MQAYYKGQSYKTLAAPVNWLVETPTEAVQKHSLLMSTAVD